MKIKIAVVDDNPQIAYTIKEKIEHTTEDIECKYIAKNGKELLALLQKDSAIDVILMDIEMPVMDGILTTEQLSSLYPEIKIIMLTVFDDDEKIFRAIQAGAMGYLLKDETSEEIIRGIRMILAGGAPMTPTIAAKALNILRNPPIIMQSTCEESVMLTKREIEILELLRDGLDYKKIADKLFISPATVRKHIEHVYEKLQVHNKMQAVQKAIKSRLIN